MSVSLVIMRPSAGGASAAVALEELKQVVGRHADLRLRSKPDIAINPKTGERIEIPAGPADSEIQINGQWLPFLQFRPGGLTAKYRSEFDDPGNPIRAKIAAVAKQLGAVIGTDAGDEVLSW